jgi:hypothetical protein
MSDTWVRVPNLEPNWNSQFWEDDVTQSEVCTIGFDCKCDSGEDKTWIHIEAVGDVVACRGCGRQYKVQIERRVVCYTPLAIRYPKQGATR